MMDALEEELEKASVIAPDGQRTVFALPNGHAIPIPGLVRNLSFDLQKLYAKIFGDAYLDALKTEGPSTFLYTQMSAALHEAGHVIVNTLGGLETLWVRIWPEPRPDGTEGWLGWNEGQYPAGREKEWGLFGVGQSRENNLRHLRGVVAGYVAERVFDKEHLGSSLDERVLATMMPPLMGDTNLDALIAAEDAVAEMLTLNESFARRIAAALIEAAPERVAGSELLKDVQLVQPPPRLSRAQARALRQMAKTAAKREVLE